MNKNMYIKHLMHVQDMEDTHQIVAILFIVSYAVQRNKNLLRSHLFIFVFISITLGGG